jgi:hypothetical protein
MKRDKTTRSFRQLLADIPRDNSGVALIEFAITLPFVMSLTIGGYEMANYASVIMQLEQITIHTADNAARIGQGSSLGIRQIFEDDINDVFEGSFQEGERIALAGGHTYVDPVTGQASIRGNTKIVLSSIEEVANFDANNPRYRIRWQRCAGSANQFSSSYGDTSLAPFTAFGPPGRQTTPPPKGAMMFVELQYHYKPDIITSFGRITDRDIKKVASMVVRDKRDFAGPPNGDGVYPSANTTPSTC